MRMSPPGPPGRANVAPWRRWLLPGIIVAFFVALFALPRGAAQGPALSYTQFLGDVSAGTVRAVTIGPAGQVTGSLTSGQPFTTTADRLSRTRRLTRLLRTHPVAGRPGSRRLADHGGRPRPGPAHQPPGGPHPARRHPAGARNRHR